MGGVGCARRGVLLAAFTYVQAAAAGCAVQTLHCHIALFSFCHETTTVTTGMCAVFLHLPICLTDLELTEDESLVLEAETATDLLERIWKALIKSGVDPESSDKMDLLRAAAGLSGSRTAAAAADDQGLGYWEPEGEFEEPVRPGLPGVLETGDGWMRLGVPGGGSSG